MNKQIYKQIYIYYRYLSLSLSLFLSLSPPIPISPAEWLPSKPIKGRFLGSCCAKSFWKVQMCKMYKPPQCRSKFGS